MVARELHCPGRSVEKVWRPAVAVVDWDDLPSWSGAAQTPTSTTGGFRGPRERWFDSTQTFVARGRSSTRDGRSLKPTASQAHRTPQATVRCSRACGVVFALAVGDRLPAVCARLDRSRSAHATPLKSAVSHPHSSRRSIRRYERGHTALSTDGKIKRFTTVRSTAVARLQPRNPAVVIRAGTLAQSPPAAARPYPRLDQPCCLSSTARPCGSPT